MGRLGSNAILIAAIAAALLAGPSPGAEGPGIVVVKVTPGSQADLAGIRPGDRLLTLNGKPLPSEETLLALLHHLFGGKCAALCLERDGRTLTVDVPRAIPGVGRTVTPGVFTRPDLDPALLQLHEEAEALLRAGRSEAALEKWTEAARTAQNQGQPAAAAYLHTQRWRLYARERRTGEGLNDALEAATQSRLCGDVAGQTEALSLASMSLAERQDFEGADDLLRQALALDLQAGFELSAADRLNGLGNNAYLRGYLAEACRLYQRSLEIRSRLAPDSIPVAASLNNLGNVAFQRGDLDDAQDFHTRSLAIKERNRKVIPDLIPSSLLNLGLVEMARGKLPEAQAYFERALVLFERIVDFAFREVVDTRNHLAEIAISLADFPAAHKHLEEAQQVQRRWKADSGLIAAETYFRLGQLAEAQGDRPKAREALDEALRRSEEVAPLSLAVARCLGRQGELALAENESSKAVALFRRAVEITEGQRRQIPVADARGFLVARHLEPYRGLIRAEVALGDIPAAFAALEAARARSLLDMFVERDADLARDAPPGLIEKQRALHDRRVAAYSALGAPGAASNPDRVRDLRQQVERLAVEQRRLNAEVRLASPRYAAIHYPEPADLATAQSALGPGTLLLAYAVDRDRTFLFAVTSSSVALHVLPVGELDLRKRVQEWRRSLANPHSGDYQRPGQELYSLLIAPVEGAVDKARRVLICPDGPLHVLPFAALVAPGSISHPHFFIERKPLHTVVSMSVYALLRAQRPNSTAARWKMLAFGDPAYVARDPRADPTSRDRPRLPATRQQVLAITRLFGKAGRAHVGTEACPGSLWSEAGDARILHFACHGLLDPADPLASAIVLGPEPGRSDGTIRAYEVMQRLRLRADLVTLGACETALGEESRHEGMIGLARAFQYAGARSVLVSHWKVLDRSTTRLMTAFYREILGGLPRDEALRRAQVSLIGTKEYAHPFHWAGFVLQGDPG